MLCVWLIYKLLFSPESCELQEDHLNWKEWAGPWAHNRVLKLESPSGRDPAYCLLYLGAWSPWEGGRGAAIPVLASEVCVGQSSRGRSSWTKEGKSFPLWWLPGELLSWVPNSHLQRVPVASWSASPGNGRVEVEDDQSIFCWVCFSCGTSQVYIWDL